MVENDFPTQEERGHTLVNDSQMRSPGRRRVFLELLRRLSVALEIEHWENRDVIVLRELRSVSPSASIVGAKPCTY
jgi:hypothetical protein